MNIGRKVRKALRTTRRKVASVIPAVIAVIPAIIGLFKKKKFVLWYNGPDRQPYLLSNFTILRESVSPGPPWFKKSAPMSKRQCEKTMHDLWALGPGVAP